MHINWRISVIVLLAAVLVLTACESDPDEPPPTVPSPEFNTLLPPFNSATPLLTATLTPSNTPSITPVTPTATPSDTPTLTSTPTLTPTPPIRGSIISTAADNVRLRSGPGTEFDQLDSFPAGTPLFVIGSELNDIRETWYLVWPLDEEGNRLVDVDSEEPLQGWILARLVVTAEEDEVPTLAPTETPTPTITATPEVTETTLPDGSSAEATTVPSPTASITPLPLSPLATPPAQLSAVNILAYCIQENERPPVVQSDQSISVYWFWWVTEPYLMASHLENVEYDVVLVNEETEEEELLDGWQQFRTEMELDENDHWRIYWYRPVGRLEPGAYTVNYRVSWTDVHYDGLDEFGPDTNTEEQTGSCRFTVVEAGE